MLLGGISLINIGLGFAREATIAYFFGASAKLDEFLVALAIPRFLVVNTAQITVAIVLPIYVGYKEAGKKEEATALVQRWFWFSGLVMAAVCAVLFAAAAPMMHVMAPGFDEEQKIEAAKWLRFMLPYVWLMAVAGIFKVVLDTERRFLAPPLAQGIISVCVIAFCALASQMWGTGSLVAGLVAGGMLGFTVQWMGSRRFEPGLPSFSLKKRVALPMAAGGVMVLQSISNQANIFIDRGFASNLCEGSVSAYNYAQTITSVPNAIVTSALATTMFPVLAKMAAGKDWSGAFRTASRWAVFLLAAGIVPVLALVFFREQVVSLLFGRGEFDSEALAMTSHALSVLPFMVLISAVSTIITRLLLAQRRIVVIAALAMFAVCMKFALSFVLVERFGLAGLAGATVAAATVATVARFFISGRKPGHA